MDDIVVQALAKWPNVPHCYRWLGLDARGQWWMRDDAAQAAGAFGSAHPASKGSLLRHDKLIAFIQRNYLADELGQWFFQNGPQRVYVDLEATPYIWRIQPAAANGHAASAYRIHSHTGQAAQAIAAWVDERGWLYLETNIGFGLVHSLDVELASQALEARLWPLHEIQSEALPSRFGFVQTPQSKP